MHLRRMWLVLGSAKVVWLSCFVIGVISDSSIGGERRVVVVRNLLATTRLPKAFIEPCGTGVPRTANVTLLGEVIVGFVDGCIEKANGNG